MEAKMIGELKKTIQHDLFHYPQYSGKQNLKYMVKRMLKPSHTPKRDAYFWPQAMMTQALETLGELEVLKSYYDRWKKEGMVLHHLDNVMNGYSLVYVYQKTGNVKYKEMLDKMYHYVLDYYQEHGGALPYRKHHPDYAFVDTLGMVVPFLYRYGSMFGIEEAAELGGKVLFDFLEKGMDKKSGLPYHGYDFHTGVKYGIVGWGRAVGWLLLALADSVEFMGKKEEKEKAVKAFQEIVKLSFEHFHETGYFNWQLTAGEGPIDTSATAMIAYAIKKGKNKAYLRCDCELEKAIARMEGALQSSYREGKIWECSGECEGFAQYPQVYGSYPWSNAPALRFLVEKE